MNQHASRCDHTTDGMQHSFYTHHYFALVEARCGAR